MTGKENPAATALTMCSEQVRRDDYARFALSLLVPRKQRKILWPLFALHLELGKIPASVKEPIMGMIRFQWWRDAISGVFAGEALHHHVLRGFGQAIGEGAGWRETDVVALIDAHESAFKAAWPKRFNQLVSECEATGLALNHLIDPHADDAAILGKMGGAYELAVLLPDLPSLWVHGKVLFASTDELSEIERVRLDATQLRARLNPAVTEWAAAIAARRLTKAERKNIAPLLLLSTEVTARKMRLLTSCDDDVFEFRSKYNEYLLLPYLTIRRLFI